MATGSRKAAAGGFKTDAGSQRNAQARISGFSQDMLECAMIQELANSCLKQDISSSNHIHQHHAANVCG